MQCAAVKILFGDMIDPPQKCIFRLRIDTWKGNCPVVAVWPPTIRDSILVSGRLNTATTQASRHNATLTADIFQHDKQRTDE